MSSSRLGGVAAAACVPDIPTPNASSTSDQSLPANRQYLKNLFRRFFGRIDPPTRCCIADVRAYLPAGRTSIGSCCSGTDSPLLVLDAFKDVLLSEFGRELRVDHAFSSESSVPKQEFIRRCHSTRLLFEDTARLGDTQAMDARTKQLQVVPAFRWEKRT